MRRSDLPRRFRSQNRPHEAPERRKPRERRGHKAKAPSRTDLADVVRETTRLWRKHHLGYDQTKYVVERVRRQLGLQVPAVRPRTVERLDRAEVERLINQAYRDSSPHGLMQDGWDQPLPDGPEPRSVHGDLPGGSQVG